VESEAAMRISELGACDERVAGRGVANVVEAGVPLSQDVEKQEFKSKVFRDQPPGVRAGAAPWQCSVDAALGPAAGAELPRVPEVTATELQSAQHSRGPNHKTTSNNARALATRRALQPSADEGGNEFLTKRVRCLFAERGYQRFVARWRNVNGGEKVLLGNY
jgi:hypothetical protein